MKVCIETYAREGIIRGLEQLAFYLSKRGYCVFCLPKAKMLSHAKSRKEILSRFFEKFFWKIEKDKENKILWIEKPELPKSFPYPLWENFNSHILIKTLKKLHPDIYIFHEPLNQKKVLPYLRKTKTKIVYDMQDLMYAFAPDFLKKKSKILDKFSMRNSNLITVKAKSLIDYVKKYNENVIWLPNGTDLRYTKKARPIFSSSKPIVGYVGTIGERFNKTLFMEIVKKLPNLIFLFVGEKPSWKLPKNVIHIGPLKNRQEIFNYIASMDVCIIPFKKTIASHFSCPLKLFDYLSLKKPVVSTTLIEIKKIAHKYVLFADSPKEFISQILNALKISRVNVPRRFLKQFSWEYILPKYEKILKNLFDEK